MPTISPTGQDVELDPFDRISRRGDYGNMLRNWQPWYGLRKLLGARGAPQSPLRVLKDLRTVSGVALGGSQGAELLRVAVARVESALSMRLPRLVSPRAQEAAGVVAELRKHHIYGLQAAALAAKLWGLRGHWEGAEGEVAAVQQRLDDPDEHLGAKRDLIEAVSLACAASMRVDLALKWQGALLRRNLRPSGDYWYELLSHCRAQGEWVRMLECWRTMGDLTPRQARHYWEFLRACSSAGRPDLFLQTQAEMRRDNCHKFATRSAYDLLIAAHARAGDADGALRQWELLSTARIARSKGGRLRLTRTPYHPGFLAVAGVLHAYAAQGRALEGYQWWRREALIPAPDQARVCLLKTAGGFRRHGLRNCSAAALAALSAALTAQGHVWAACELFDEVRQRWLGPLNKRAGSLLRVPTAQGPSQRFPVTGALWRAWSGALAASGRLAESHYCLTMLVRWRYPVGCADFVPLLAACSQGGGSPTVAAATVSLMQSAGVRPSPEAVRLLGRVREVVAAGEAQGGAPMLPARGREDAQQAAAIAP